MKVTIIPIDGAVYKDGYSYSQLDLSFVPNDIHALQFNTTSNAGWIEFKEDDFGEKPSNEKIISMPEWANTCLVKWDEAKAEEERAKAEAARIAEESSTKQQTMPI